MPEARMNAPSNPALRCLIVEDDADFAALEAQVIRDEGGTPTLCRNLAAAAHAAASAAFDLVLLDNHLPDGQAYDWYESLRRRFPDVPVVMITGLPDLSEAVSLTRNGLFDYLTKPLEMGALVDLVRRARLHQQHPEGALLEDLSLGSSDSMRHVLTQLEQAARHPAATVLLCGETGTGKDVAARALHRLTFGPRAGEAPYIALNCAAVPPEMFEAELFGAERGAYTGADKRRAGLLDAAQGGTLFLDEIGEVPLAIQAKLLRILEGREFRALGSPTNHSFTGRFVTATNRVLRDEVAAGRFREDLLFRIEVFTVELPPLRNRLQDLPELTVKLMEQLSRKYGRQPLLLSPEDLAALRSHAFPGNIRELRNILERSLLRTSPDSKWLSLSRTWLPGNTPHPTKSLAANPPEPTGPLPATRAGLTPIEEQEYRLVRDALREARGGIRRAAAKLGLSPQALLRRLEKWPELRQAGTDDPPA